MKRVTAGLAAVAVGLGVLIGGAAPANAGTWVPSKPKVVQPFGWGDTCLLVRQRYHYDVWKWLTPSVGKSVCIDSGKNRRR